MRRTILLVAPLFFAACVHQGYVPGQRRTPDPLPGVTHEEARIDGVRDLKLLRQIWRPAGEPAAVLVIVHGLKDYSDRYARVAEALVKRNIAVYSFDLRGHGDSEGDRVWVDDFDDYVSDAERVVREAQMQYKNKKVFLFGHSMGGAIATRLVEKDETRVDGLILSAAALQPLGSLQAFGVSFLGTVFPTLGLLELNDQKFSRDPQVVASMSADPLIYDGKGPAHTARELVSTISGNMDGAKRLSLPLLVLHGTKDEVTDPEGSKRLFNSASSADKQLKLYDGLVHDLVHEPERSQVVADIGDWLEAHAR